MRPRARADARAALLAAAAVPCLPFLVQLAAGQTLWFRDWSLYFLPMKALVAELWRAGELPLWDPAVRGGLPLLANPQTGALYPPTLLLVAFGANPGLTLFLLLHVAAAGAGFHLLLREARLPTAAALVGALGFACGGYVASLPNVLNNLQTVAWVPWMLLFALRVTRRPSAGAWSGLVAAGTLALLGGELQLAALGAAAAGALALSQPADGDPSRSGAARARGRLRATGLLALAGLAAAGLAAHQLVPTAELVRESVRSDGLPFELAADASLEPAALFGVAFPRPALPGDAERGASVRAEMPWLLSAYAGVAVVWLAALGCAGPRRRWTALWCSLALLGVLLALGRHSALFRVAHELLPPFRSVRYPEKFLLLTALALPALAAAGLETILARRIQLSAVLAGGAAVIASAAGSLLWIDGAGRPPGGVALLGAVAVGVPTAALLVSALTGRLRPAAAAGLLCTLAAMDLLVAGWGVNPGVPWRFYQSSWAAGVLAREGADRSGERIRSTPLHADMEQVAVVSGARIFSNHYLFQQGLAPNLGQLHGWMHQDGLSGIETRATAEQIDAVVAREDFDVGRAMRLLRLQSVGWLVTSLPLPTEEAATVAAHPELPLAVLRLRDPLPRGYVVTGWEIEPAPAAALERALAPAFDPAERVVLDRQPPAPDLAGPSSATAPRVRAAEWGASRLRLDVESPGPGVVVVTDSWYPGWQASVDGAPAPVLRANGYGRAVAVPAGRHRVELAYRPASFVAGAAVSAATALLLGGGFALSRRRARAARAGAAAGSSVRPARSPEPVEVA